MDLTRRHFLRGTLGLVGGTLLPRIPSYLPVVFLDGTHDDGPGLNALFRGNPVAILNEAALIRPSAQEIILSKARILTREQIVVPRGVGVPTLFISDCHVDARELPEGAGHALCFESPLRISGPSAEISIRGLDGDFLKGQQLPYVSHLYIEGPARKPGPYSGAIRYG